jgi:hypothetical protein
MNAPTPKLFNLFHAPCNAAYPAFTPLTTALPTVLAPLTTALPTFFAVLTVAFQTPLIQLPSFIRELPLY